MTSTNDKVRSLILAALMVMSVFAGTVAFTGSAAAATAGNLEISPDAADEGTTNDHTVTLTATIDASDSQKQNLVVEMPDQVSLGSSQVTDVSITSGSSGVSYQGSSNVDSTNNNVNVTINDDGGSGSQAITVEYTLTNVELPGNVNSNTDVDARFGIDDNADGDYQDSDDVNPNSGPTKTLTVQDTSPVGASASGADATLQSGVLFYQGQQLYASGPDATTFEVREVTGSGTDIGLGPTLVQFETNSSGEAIVDTEELGNGDYVVVQSGSRNQPRTVQGGSNAGEIDTSSTPSISDASFDITVQELSAEFDDSEVDDDESTTLEVRSAARSGAFNVTVDADGLNNGDLENIFAENDAYVNADDDVEFATNGDDDVNANFTDIDRGDYEFNLSVTDTTAEASDSITVVRADDAELGLNESSYTVESGDTVNVTVTFTETTSGFLQVGSFDDGYNTTVEVVDDDEDGMANVTVNTFNTNSGNTGGVSSADEGDTEVNPVPGGVNASVSGALDSGNYDISVTRQRADLNATTPDNVGTLAVTDRSTTSAAPWVTFRSAADDLSTGDDVIAAIEDGDVTQRQNVAEDDFAVIQVQASGIFGYLANNENSNGNIDASSAFGAVDDDTETTPLSLQIEQSNPDQNRDEKIIQNDDVSFIRDDERNMLFIVIPTSVDATRDGGSTTVGLEDGDRFNVTFEVNAVDEDDNAQTLNTGDRDQRVSANFRVTEREAPLNTNADDEVEVTASEDAEITGTSTIAPGSEITVRVRSESGAEDPFVFDQTVNVSEDGTYNATFDFGDRAVGTNFTASVSAQPGLNGDTEFDGVVVEQVETDTPTPTPTDTPTATPTATPTPTPDDGTDTPTPTDTDTTTTTTPGFGAVVAVLALLGAALLALRRD